jgi:soluble lytic murein transglycosylase
VFFGANCGPRALSVGTGGSLIRRQSVIAAGGLAGALIAAAATAAPHLKHVPLPRPRPQIAGAPAPVTTAQATAKQAPAVAEYHTASLPSAAVPLPREEAPPAPSTGFSERDIATVKQALEFARRGRSQDATDIGSRIEDPTARKLVEWAILHSDNNNDATFARYRAFVTANPNWPYAQMFRRRAEGMLWQEGADLATIRGFSGNSPASTKGAFALARALLATGDRAAAQALIRGPWISEQLSPDLEEQALQTFGGLITPADEKARMARRLYAHDNASGLRAAHRLGGGEPAIAKAWVAANEKSSNAKSLLDALPASVQRDPCIIFARIHVLRHADKIAEATELMMAAPKDAAAVQDTDEWWVERRLLTRKLLDLNQPNVAYQIARDAATPIKENYRVESQFTAGWIALRFLNNPSVAAQHFTRIAQTTNNPISLARANYWRGRAAEAMNRSHEAHGFYQEAARYNTAYYGQLARARLGMPEIVVSAPPDRHASTRSEVARAVEMLYAANERDLVVSIAADLGEHGQDMAAMAGAAEVISRNQDARALLLLGKGALGRGYPFDHYAFPTFGLPRYSAIGPEVGREIVYAIARQESAFNPRDRSAANAIGLMQVTPSAGREMARKFNVSYDERRLINDQVYNMQLGAAELGDVIEGYRGSYILAFAGYNAGRGRVKEWIERYGDPRDPSVDPVDWVERIPFAETRNYVQRILENIQVYRVRFGGSPRLLIEADLRRGAESN